jgi:Domain of unknown function (DUF4395)
MAVSMVDHSALKVNQAGIILTVLVAVGGSAFSTWFELLIPALAVVMLLGTWRPDLALFKRIYFKLLKPRGIVKPRLVEDSPVPHNFAQGLGGVFVVVATVLLPLSAIAGLTLSLLVAVLAFINLAFGYCVGCQVYFLLGRTGVLKQA